MSSLVVIKTGDGAQNRSVSAMKDRDPGGLLPGRGSERNSGCLTDRIHPPRRPWGEPAQYDHPGKASAFLP